MLGGWVFLMFVSRCGGQRWATINICDFSLHLSISRKTSYVRRLAVVSLCSLGVNVYGHVTFSNICCETLALLVRRNRQMDVMCKALETITVIDAAEHNSFLSQLHLSEQHYMFDRRDLRSL